MIWERRLCGIIVAGRDSLPWAYMALIEDIFENMQSYLEESSTVSLPSEAKFGKARSQNEAVSFTDALSNQRGSEVGYHRNTEYGNQNLVDLGKDLEGISIATEQSTRQRLLPSHSSRLYHTVFTDSNCKP